MCPHADHILKIEIQTWVSTIEHEIANTNCLEGILMSESGEQWSEIMEQIQTTKHQHRLILSNLPVIMLQETRYQVRNLITDPGPYGPSRGIFIGAPWM
jgi:hypothetical protein